VQRHCIACTQRPPPHMLPGTAIFPKPPGSSSNRPPGWVPNTGWSMLAVTCGSQHTAPHPMAHGIHTHGGAHDVSGGPRHQLPPAHCWAASALEVQVEQLVQLLCAATRMPCSAGSGSGWGHACNPAGGKLHTALVAALYGGAWVHLGSTARPHPRSPTPAAHAAHTSLLTGGHTGCL
jgi:hypothetical protein